MADIISGGYKLRDKQGGEIELPFSDLVILYDDALRRAKERKFTKNRREVSE
jgi:hypothetical protein